MAPRLQYISNPVSTRTTCALAWIALQALGCASSAMHVPGAPSGSSVVVGFEGEETSVEPGKVRLRPSVCEKLPLREEFKPLDADDFARFLKSQGFEVRVTTARVDLAFVDLLNAGTAAPIRFRVAVLADAGAAGRDLHVALLQHGQGSWGVHRSNLAVLAPPGSPDDIVAFAARTKVACWGVLTMTGLDDTFVIPGGYAEL
jgi:hypothetical protein